MRVTDEAQLEKEAGLAKNMLPHRFVCFLCLFYRNLFISITATITFIVFDRIRKILSIAEKGQ